MEINKDNVLYFGSGTKCKELSNLYKCEILYKGNVYNSVENVYQSLKFIESDHHRFMKCGDLGGYDGLIKYGNIFYGNNKSKEEIEKKMEYWRKKNCIGIIAKMSGNIKYSKKLGLTFIGIKNDVFKEILKIKFENEKFKKILENSKGKYLVEFSRSCKKNFEKGIIEKWCGLVDDNKLYGENLMGNIIMDIRENL
jgi:predicted NAD-dependent protein-ADP-ribosyltransferase YbiA (DUF1768 family)